MSVEDIVKEKILNYLKSNGDVWIRSLAKKLKISPATASSYINKLEKDGLVKTKIIGSSKVVRLKDK